MGRQHRHPGPGRPPAVRKPRCAAAPAARTWPHPPFARMLYVAASMCTNCAREGPSSERDRVHMCTAPPTLSRNAHKNSFRAQSHIVCCPTAFRPDFRRRLPDQEWRSSRVRRRLLRRLKVFQVSGAHGTTAPSAKPPPLARSRTQPPLPPSPPLLFCAHRTVEGWLCRPSHPDMRCRAR